MTKKALVSIDPLVMAVRKALRDREPRPSPVNPHKSQYGFDLIECPKCHASMREAGYNSHWSALHGTPFWKELHIIEVINKEIKK